MKIICFIFARGNSKGLKNKNILKFKNTTLLGNSINQAKKISLIKDIYVSTDSEKIIKKALFYGAKVPFKRPKMYSGDRSPEIYAWRHALKFLKKKKLTTDYIVTLPVTSPLRSLTDIKKCIKLAISKKLDYVFTVNKSNRNPYFNIVQKDLNKVKKVINKKNIFRRQDAPVCYDMNNACFVFSSKYILTNTDVFRGKCDFVVMPKSRSIDIDDYFDYKLIKKLSNK
tara:strand:- start:13775 stop:14455 length:681 start_codon:yes stop_codon:yes gene_type:complete